MVGSLLLFTALSMSVWAHHMFTTGQVTVKYFSLTSTLLIVPAGIEYLDMVGDDVAAARSGCATPMLFALGFILQFLIGGLTGICVGSPPLDYHVHDTLLRRGALPLHAVRRQLFGRFAAVYYWWPKVTGPLLRERLGRMHFWLLVRRART